jgi:hypothetical protein
MVSLRKPLQQQNLGISRSNLIMKVERYGLEKKS